ncbi:uncharacterized protein LOC122304540 [Carya illinoinensis]|uniref:uncharacterized protein LOC122304540 n=1 Tax=Carya illinoinensis TaxID=32201 RepID=UPI001C71CFE2|nr:uncharacterized protein LOC122304540 [Carya illinoinensis]
MSKKTAQSMRWHAEERVVDPNFMRHPADSTVWKDFDDKHALFAQDPRNVRLGLASDGFNPFNNMSKPYSIWPVLLVPYNLPPWLCMKDPYVLMSLLIPGPKAPENDIDVFLRPLIDELTELWEEGIHTYDAYKRESFQLRAALLWIINDFPTYANLSGWSTKGKFACPTCTSETDSLWLVHGRKHCYMGHRRWLVRDHSWRRKKSAFNGKEEHRLQPNIITGQALMEQLHEVSNVQFGKSAKKRKRAPNELNWTKKSIFFELPYWSFCARLSEVKFPDGFASNIARCVNVTEGKIMGMKSHDCHIFMQYLLPIVIGGYLRPDVRRCLLELSSFFKELCSRALDITVLKRLQANIPIILCKLEMIFPPTFFDIMVHLAIHLPNEALLAGPVQYRWMYPFERYMGKFKRYVRNRAHPEGSIAEAYLHVECLTFCSMYLNDIETRHNREERNTDTVGLGPVDPSLSVFVQKIAELHAKSPPTVTDDIFALACGPDPLVASYAGCIMNGIRFHTKQLEGRRRTQNSGVVVHGEHIGFPMDFYGVLQDIIELRYMGWHLHEDYIDDDDESDTIEAEDESDTDVRHYASVNETSPERLNPLTRGDSDQLLIDPNTMSHAQVHGDPDDDDHIDVEAENEGFRMENIADVVEGDGTD